MRTFKLRVFCAIVALSSIVTGYSADEFFIRDGDRVVFLGDSITEQRLYTTYIEAYALTRYPEWKLRFRNVGWGGDTAWLRQRARPNETQLFAAEPEAQQKMVEDAVGRGLARDVLPLEPTAVTIKFGMNDHSYQPFREDIFRAYMRSQTELVKTLKQEGARVALLTPQPIEEKRADLDQDPRNQSLRKFSDGLRQVAEEKGTLYADQFAPYMEILLRERADNPANLIGGGDAVHPGPIGHTVMAWAVLKELGASPMVSSVEIDLSNKHAKTQHCRIENLQISNGTLGFERKDEALPMPLDERAKAALKLAPILEDLNQYLIKVTGLPEGSYAIKIDGEEVARRSAAELAEGCNLATNAGPVTQQAQKVLDLVFRKNNIFFNRWRNVQLFNFPDWAQSAEVEKTRTTELARLDQQIADLESEIDSARKPQTRQFEIQRASE